MSQGLLMGKGHDAMGILRKNPENQKKTIGSEVAYAFDQFRLASPILFALVDRARQEIIIQLSAAGGSGMNVTDLAQDSGLSRPAISHHLKVLKDAGIVSTQKMGTQVFYRLDLKNKSFRLEGLVKALQIIIDQATKYNEQTKETVKAE